MGTGVSALGFKMVVESISKSLDTLPLMLCCITDMHSDMLSITGLAVKSGLRRKLKRHAPQATEKN
jgi:hypothetical protein